MSVAGKLPKSASVTAGYSGKALWIKLGLRPELRIFLRDAPDDYWDLCAFDPASIGMAAPRQTFDFGHVFVTSKAALQRALKSAVGRLEPGGMLWISWPKKSSGVTTDLTEDTLRELILPLGLVDVKVCAVSEVWSGLKFVWRVARR